MTDFDDSRDYFPTPIDLVLVDAHLLIRPPDDAQTMAEAVEQIVMATLPPRRR